MVQFYLLGQCDTIFRGFPQTLRTMSDTVSNIDYIRISELGREKVMQTPVIIGLVMIVAGLGLAGWIAYTVLHQRKEERRRSED